MSRIYLSSPHMSEEDYELNYIQDAFKNNWIAPIGENLDQFEKSMAELVGVKYSTALSSGTAALHLALLAAEVGEGDIVFCQSLTFAASANAIKYFNAIPVFIDSEKGSWNMDPQLLEEAFKKYQPKAVMAVHLYGIAGKIDQIKAICDKHQVLLIEDAAADLNRVNKIIENMW